MQLILAFSDIDSTVTCTGSHLTMTSSNAAVVANGAVVLVELFLIVVP